MKNILTLTAVLLTIAGGVYANTSLEQLKTASGSDRVAPPPAAVSVQIAGVKFTGEPKWECNAYARKAGNQHTVVPLGILGGPGASKLAFISPFRFNADISRVYPDSKYLRLSISRTDNADLVATILAPLPKEIGDIVQLDFGTVAISCVTR